MFKYFKQFKNSIFISVLFLIFFLTGCGASSKEKLENAILTAQIYLNTKECDKALDAINSVASDGSNSNYLITKASAYACKANYSTIRLFSDDVDKFGNPSVFGGLARFSTSSSMDAYDNDEYTNLENAINILLYADGKIDADKDPTSDRRAAVLTPEGLSDVNSFLVYLIMAQLGKYAYYYGNASSTGVKGSGTLGNTCYLNYSNNAAKVLILADPPGSCTDPTNHGHADLGATGSLNVERMCQGVVLVNNLLALIETVLAAMTGNELDAVNIADLKTQLANVSGVPGASNVVSVLSQTKCETDNATDDQYLQLYFAAVIENLHL